MRHANATTDLDHTLIALADPTRRAILTRLSEGAARVTDIAADFPISLNSVSKHIQLLERARLVERQVEGREHMISYRAEPLDAAGAWIATQKTVWAQNLERLAAILPANGETE